MQAQAPYSRRGWKLNRIGGYCKASNSCVAECMAMLQGLWQAQQLDLANILVRSDALEITNFVKGRTTTPWFLQSSIAKICYLEERLKAVQFEHISRKRNQEAHRQANFGKSTCRHFFY